MTEESIIKKNKNKNKKNKKTKNNNKTKPTHLKDTTKSSTLINKSESYKILSCLKKVRSCRGKISYFGLARNLIRHLISPNQDDLSYSARTFHFRPTNWVSCQTHSLWLENADQCRRHTGRSSIAMLFSWTMPPSANVSLRL